VSDGHGELPSALIDWRSDEIDWESIPFWVCFWTLVGFFGRSLWG
jgi:hypothetical protein